jgi:hypothetical protein
VVLDGTEFRALRHNMAGQDGYELRAGEKFGLVHVGALAYASASVESGWIPSPVPAICADPDLAGYRAWLPLFGMEGQRPLVFDPSDVRAVLGEDLGYYLTYARHRVEEVSVVWGEHPGAGTSPDADLGFPRIRATVAPAPYDATRGRNTGAPNCARVLLWSAPIMYFARRVFAR